MSKLPFIHWFRQSSPYIHTHRGKTFVLHMGDEFIFHAHFANLIGDLALLNSLGIRLLLVYGIENGIKNNSIHGESRVDSTLMSHLKSVVGHIRTEFESHFSKSIAHSPMGGSKIRLASGNFVIAKPLGIRNGMDLGFRGEVRKIDRVAIEERLKAGEVTLLSPFGYSLTGETFYIASEKLAVSLATELKADKLIFLVSSQKLLKPHKKLIREITIEEAEEFLKISPSFSDTPLSDAIEACKQGVPRVHFINGGEDGALLQELFTRDGCGTLLTRADYETCRQARIEDVGGILTLIEPLEREGILVRRGREGIERDIERFVVIERDGTIIGCAALHLFLKEATGEVACLAVHTEYRKSGRAEKLLNALQTQAKALGLKRLVVLTTHATHWFLEREFYAIGIQDLPLAKQRLYNYQRRSKVFAKDLQ